MLQQELKTYINAAFSGIWIQTSEPDEAFREITELLANALNWTGVKWDCAAGTTPNGEGKQDPLAPLKQKQPLSDPDATHLVVLCNYHKFVQSPLVMQSLYNAVVEGKATRTIFIVLAPVVQIPIELEKVFVVLEHQLPNQEQLGEMAQRLQDDNAIKPSAHDAAAIAAAAGLTRYEAEGAFAISLAQYANLSPTTVWELKAQMLKKSGLMTLHRGTESFADLGGLDALKLFCKAALNAQNQTTKAKGVLLLGVPGTGKSAFAKALGNETNRPTIILDTGSLMGSLVGETEGNIRRALKIADAMQPCILFIDEIEKAVAGATSTHQGDNGVKAGMLGAFLTWMNDHTTDVFVVCTSNDIAMLPPEFSRAERFDGIFFIDLPTQKEQAAIWNIYTEQFNVGDINDDVDSAKWTGAEIKACCRLSALLNLSMNEAAKYIVPIASTASTKINDLRDWANGKCLDATLGGIYQNAPKTAPQKRVINHRKEHTCSP